MGNTSQFIEKNELTRLQQAVRDFYDDHPNSSRIECCKAVYGGSNVFQLQNLSSIECALRKKGYLFYTVNGRIIDMAREDIDIELKLKIQKSIGKKMVGFIKSNVRIMQVATDEKQLYLAKDQFKESVMVLVQNNFIDLKGVGKILLEHKGQEENVNQLK